MNEFKFLTDSISWKASWRQTFSPSFLSWSPEQYPQSVCMNWTGATSMIISPTQNTPLGHSSDKNTCPKAQVSAEHAAHENTHKICSEGHRRKPEAQRGRCQRQAQETSEVSLCAHQEPYTTRPVGLQAFSRKAEVYITVSIIDFVIPGAITKSICSSRCTVIFIMLS